MLSDRSPTTHARPERYASAILLLGIGCITVQTLITLAQDTWTTEAGAHGPIVLAIILWLLIRKRDVLARPKPIPLLPVLIVLLPVLALYVLARIIHIDFLEIVSLILALGVVVWGRYGKDGLIGLGAIPIFCLFLIVPPANWIAMATMPIKELLSHSAVSLLSWAGYTVGSSGVVIQIDNYQLLVATACSGLNSLIGLTFICFLYLYLRHQNDVRYILLGSLFAFPVAVLTNFIRIVLIILITHYFGDAVGSGWLHTLTGTGLFVIALLVMILIDKGLSTAQSAIYGAQRRQKKDEAFAVDVAR